MHKPGKPLFPLFDYACPPTSFTSGKGSLGSSPRTDCCPAARRRSLGARSSRCFARRNGASGAWPATSGSHQPWYGSWKRSLDEGFGWDSSQGRHRMKSEPLCRLMSWLASMSSSQGIACTTANRIRSRTVWPSSDCEFAHRKPSSLKTRRMASVRLAEHEPVSSWRWPVRFRVDYCRKRIS